MPKRSAQEKLERYKRKIQRLEDKEKRRRRVQRLLDSSDEENITDTIDPEPQDISEQQEVPPAQSLEDGQVAPAGASELSEDLQDATTPSSEIEISTSLDPELLSALGASTTGTPEFGADIHESLSNLWTPLLKKGLPKEDKDRLFKEHLVPANCKLLQAPKLNAEISAAVSDIVRGRDKKLAVFQQQLGTGTAVINRAMDTLLKTNDKVSALKHLSDACRMLSDLHYVVTKDRIKLITPSLEKSFLHVIQDSERDDTLFGQSLSEKIKASKAIEKQGSLIRKAAINQVSATQTSVTRPVPQGNWPGPPRYPSNRGGRGGQRRPMVTARRTYPSQSKVQTKNSRTSKTSVQQQ